MKKRIRFNRRKFISRIAGLTFLVVLSVMSFLSISGSLTADALIEPITYNYKVQSGDTLWEIAKSIKEPQQDTREVVFEITQINQLPNSIIHPGQVIMLPGEAANEL